MEPQYRFEKLEPEMLSLWLKEEAFAAPTPQEAKRQNQKPFCIMMPPPNANDPLHLGHAMFVTAEDILIRYHRMKGDATLWLPGTDHAGIETQYVYEKKLNKQGKSRFNFDRETLYRMIWDYVQENSQTAIAQMKRLGASADWDKTVFMLEPNVVALVLDTFTRMFSDGLIYRDLRLINYCTRCGTGYSDLEVVYEQRNDPLYYLTYGPFELATVRPETKFGDTALAVHPKDARYQQWIGKEIEVEGLLGPIRLTVIADEYVDPTFGTGVVKITPAHDHNDYEVGLRHQLPIKQVIDLDGRLTKEAGPYAGLKVAEARARVVADLQAKGLITRIETTYKHNVATCYRCKNIIEPMLLPQFFINVKPLTKKVLEAMDLKQINVHGAGHDKILKHWLTQLKDWNISRQIVWGIRMPVWYKIATNHESLEAAPNSTIMVGFLDSQGTFIRGRISELLKEHDFEEIEKGLQILMAPQNAVFEVSLTKPGKDYLQETDTFDTWFSSSQWPITALKTQGEEFFTYYYPTSVMETGYDILPMWVMRMLMMGLYLTGKTPFSTIYLHGLIRDEKGQKMSKSKGNAINPLELVDKYGADALRMAIIMSTTPGHDIAMGETKVRGMRNLGNKIWNATRYTISKQHEAKDSDIPTATELNYQKRLREVVNTVSRQLDSLKIGLAAETVYNEFWHWWCDEVLESHKTLAVRYDFIKEGMKTFLKLLHPYVPFVTEACWRELVPQATLLAKQDWPTKRQSES